ncbi:DUF4113 domain-containing protein [Desulfonatronum parangueonense]
MVLGPAISKLGLSPRYTTDWKELPRIT